ncbi:MAG: KamA family radical SAM protein [Chlamydiae bacterium]|nr:KamA family radical SAM protein [Chlamydiota bacterium]
MALVEKKTFIRLAPLFDFLEFSEQNRDLVWDRPKFPLMVPLRLAKKMEKNNPSCPLFLQFVPLKKEMLVDETYSCEPVKDPIFKLSPKLLKKYEGRSLLLTTKACAMHCRYCFRQNFSYETTTKGFDKEIELLQKNTSIHEVILSGGDPLSLNCKDLLDLMTQLERIEHVQIIRFHTRTLIADPDVVQGELLNFFQNTNKKIVFVVHVNHPKELGEDLLATFKRLKSSNVTLLSQSVLLKGINDDPQTLKDLCFELFQHGVLPYYLHQLDRVQGAAHFYVEREKGCSLIEELRASLPGYLVPKYVEEIPKKSSKTPIFSLHAI